MALLQNGGVIEILTQKWCNRTFILVVPKRVVVSCRTAKRLR